MFIKNVIGNLIESDAQYIVHQCNCVTNNSAGLAKTIFLNFPYSDVYKGRTDPDKLGTMYISGDGEEHRYVINLFGQFFPGICKSTYGNKDNTTLREEAFKKCLDELSDMKDLESIAFPWGIGCGMAGGDWDKYEKMISKFALKNFLTDVYVVRLK